LEHHDYDGKCYRRHPGGVFVRRGKWWLQQKIQRQSPHQLNPLEQQFQPQQRPE
jgi:hypothetical protein